MCCEQGDPFARDTSIGCINPASTGKTCLSHQFVHSRELFSGGGILFGAKSVGLAKQILLLIEGISMVNGTEMKF